MFKGLMISLLAGILSAVYGFALEAAVPIVNVAEQNGAGYWKIMWRIAFPLMLDFIAVVTTLQFLYVLSGAAQNVILLTSGGPGTATFTIGYYLYDQAFRSGRLGYSQAIGVLIFFTGVIVIFFIRRLSTRFSY
jgi:multiple sugar transport system permease protein